MEIMKDDLYNQKLDYQKGDLIGKGTFGKVYKALEKRNGSLFAVKAISLSRKLSHF